ncbi:MAG: NAD-dependent protein deacylase [Endomicrobium sp.]|jgi:NAD-dependent deacetylase|nr:NAD-dependent protein deacylase [Endomicrobium sp.]
MKEIVRAANILKSSKYAAVFTGAGISVESGIPPFRGANGVWSKYEEKLFELNYFLEHTRQAWQMLCDGFYETTLKAKPNAAHIILARLEALGIIKCVITQNIDNLHTAAGGKTVYELHGNAFRLYCLNGCASYSANSFDFKSPPICEYCKSILKPDFVFFGENLPPKAFEGAQRASEICDVMLVIGSTGTVYPAASFPRLAKQNQAIIIEINPEISAFTNSITDIFIPMKAVAALESLETAILSC